MTAINQQTEHAQSAEKWSFMIDRGGTFTDVIGRDPQGQLHSIKMLSVNKEQYQDAAIAGMIKLLGLPPGSTLTSELVESVKMGTTVATNALLERKGAEVVYVTTEGFEDSARIGYQNRPDIFARNIELPSQLYKEVIGIKERVLADGKVYTELNEEKTRSDLQAAFDRGIRSVAINLMHGYKYQDHETRVGQIAKEIGFTQISISHKVMPVERFVARGDTTIVDAYLSPILREYVEQVRGHMPGVPLLFMKSDGGLTDADSFQGKDALLSGPAGGIIGVVKTALQARHDNIVAFDMGGTSTDVSHYSGELETQFETKVAGVRVCAPMLSIHTVAAGGGSKLHYDNGRMTVGPDSAGANPGPACYRRGGDLTITDCNVMLGKIQPVHFPCVFGPQADQPIDREIVVRKFTSLAEQISKEQGKPISAEQVAEGFLAVAVNSMANAVKVVSTQKGHDVSRNYTLATFGGAGGQHACQIADSLGINKIFSHKLAGVLSAYGMGLADQTVNQLKTFNQPLTQQGLDDAVGIIDSLKIDTSTSLIAQGVDEAGIEFRTKLHLKYRGVSSQIEVSFAELESVIAEFKAAHDKLFGFNKNDQEIIIQSISVDAIGRAATNLDDFSPQGHRQGPLQARDYVTIYSGGEHHPESPLYSSDDMQPGDSITGPAIIIDGNGTTIVEPGWRAAISASNQLELERYIARKNQIDLGVEKDPVMLEIFNNLFMYNAELMGHQLRLSAMSTNIRDRLDFSCAIFDAKGSLVANAPHIPVHLGSMEASIRTVIDKNPGMKPGDVFMLNDPYNGGTHLPDITVVSPVFDRAEERVLFYVASRGHHADVGGLTPGSMAPNSKTINDEGVLINNMQIVRDGIFCEEEIRQLFSSGPYPARNIPENLADLQAQIAANNRGAAVLNTMVDRYGAEVVHAYMQHIQDNAEESVRQAIERLTDGSFELPLDNGAIIKVKITVDQKDRSATIDFTGTSNQQSSNFNAPQSITTAAVLYVFRTLVNSSIPLNAGCLKPLSIILPEGSMLNPLYPAAVVAGNVEVSSAVTNAIYGALGIMAGAPATMNNLTFGNSTNQYYETIAGGSAAGIDHDGTSVVQTNMTNSLITDPEVLERIFNVAVLEHSIVSGTGGNGKFHGGDGALRRILFLEERVASILSNNRIIAPFGMNGGMHGATGSTRVVRKNGEIEELLSCDSRSVYPGDMIEIRTTGGGGFGEAA